MNSEQISDKLTGDGWAISNVCVNPGDYKTPSEWQITVTRGNQGFSTPYSMGAAHRVWEKGATTARDVNQSDIKHKRVGKAGERVSIHNSPTQFQVDLWEKYTEPSTPELADVVYSLVSDASCVRHGQTFEDFAADLGYDEDSRKAEKIYSACRDIWSAMIRLGADLDALDEMFQDY